MDDAEAMTALLEATGEAGVDIVPLAFDRFFAEFPDAPALFPHVEAAAGRMVNETLEALFGLAEDAWWVETTVVNFVDLHRNYGDISAIQWVRWVDIVIDVLVESTGQPIDIGAPGEAAWRRQAEQLKAMIAGV